MQTNGKVQRLALAMLVAAGMAALPAQAQYLNTFDDSGSFSTGPRTYSPPPIVISPDFSDGYATLSDTWSANDAAGNPLSGSVKLTWAGASNSGGGAAFVFDLFSTGQNYVGGTLSFDLMVDPSSAHAANGEYGYMQIAARNTDSYSWNNTSFGTDIGASWSGYTTPGTWVPFSIGLDATTGASIRAIDFQDYFNGKGVNGDVILYIDNLQFTPAPEPSSLALCGLAGCAALLGLIRRRKE